MRLSRRTLLAAAAGLSLAAMVQSPAFAGGTVVKVTLWDKGAEAPMSMGLAMGMHGDMSMATMGIDATPNSIKAGEVTFEATNTSKDVIHEMVVAPVVDRNKPLPYNESEAKVDEDAAGHLGEVEELDPGTSGKLTLRLKPGTYILYCNLPYHYVGGMWTYLTVTP